MKKFTVLFLAFALALSACKSGQQLDLADGLYANIKTNKGDIVLKLEYEKTPVTVANFVSLAEGTNNFVSDKFKGKKYYDGLIFHRVMKNFMIQGGDPESNGMGNPGYRFKDEFTDSLTHYKKGILSMANSGPKTNGSQFFITHRATPNLNGRHTVFGEVVEGLAVVDSIANVPTTKTPDRKDRPEDDVVMETIEILRFGKEAKAFDPVQIMTDYFAEEERLLAEQTKLREAAAKYKPVFATELAAQKLTAEELPSGLRILKLKEGTGEKPKIGQTANVYYAGWLADGTLFDTNIEDVARKFAVFDQRRMDQGGYSMTAMVCSPQASIVPGFREGLLTLKVGDKVRLFIPKHLGFGPQQYGPIPGDSELVFDLEMVEIVQQ